MRELLDLRKKNLDDIGAMACYIELKQYAILTPEEFNKAVGVEEALSCVAEMLEEPLERVRKAYEDGLKLKGDKNPVDAVYYACTHIIGETIWKGLMNGAKASEKV